MLSLFHGDRWSPTKDEGRHQLRSANSRTCVVRRSCSSYGDRCFAAAGPRLWNCLSTHLRRTDINYELFEWLLKIFLTRYSYAVGRLWHDCRLSF